MVPGTQSATHSGADRRQRTVQLFLVPQAAEQNLDAAVGAQGRAKLPYLGHFARSDVEGLDGLHQLVWAVEAGWRTVVRPRCGFF